MIRTRAVGCRRDVSQSVGPVHDPQASMVGIPVQSPMSCGIITGGEVPSLQESILSSRSVQDGQTRKNEFLSYLVQASSSVVPKPESTQIF